MSPSIFTLKTKLYSWAHQYRVSKTCFESLAAERAKIWRNIFQVILKGYKRDLGWEKESCVERDFYVRDMTYFFERTEYEGEGGMLAFSFHPAIQHRNGQTTTSFCYLKNKKRCFRVIY